jgi:putative copper resistance protein D
VLDWSIIATRLLQFAAALILFGLSLFYLYGLGGDGAAGTDGANASPLPAPGTPSTPGRSLLLLAAGVALASTLLLIMAETAALSADSSDALRPSALMSVLSETRFGRLAALRVGWLALSIIAAVALPAGKRLWLVQSVFGGILVASFAWSGHGAMNQGATRLLHLGADVLHLLAAGIWIGALLALSLLLRRSLRTRAPTHVRQGAYALARFSGVGPAVVAVLILTGCVNSWYLIGPTRWRELFTSPYGLLLSVKLALFAVMLVLAAANRLRLAPQLGAALLEPAALPKALRWLRASLIAETVLALLVLGLVAVLGTLAPPVSL